MTTPTVPQLREGLRGWLSAHASDLVQHRDERVVSAEDGWSRSAGLMQQMFDAGWNRWGWPEEVGGLGGSPILRNALYDELESSGYPVPEQYVQVEVQGPSLIRFAPHIAAEIMPAALCGKEMWAQGFSEPGAGSDLASLRFKAVRDGDHFVLNGQKTWSSYAVAACRIGMLTRTGTPESRHRGLTYFMLDLQTPGIEVRPITYANGRNELAEVFFDDVRIPEDRLVGEENGGWSVAMYLLQFERANYGWMRQAHVTRQLGQLARSVPASADAASRLGQVWLTNLALRGRSGATARRLAAGDPIGPEASIDKVLLATAEQGLTDAARDLLPAAFLFEDTDDAALSRSNWFYSRAASIYGGTGEVQRNIIADHLLGLPKEVSLGR